MGYTVDRPRRTGSPIARGRTKPQEIPGMNARRTPTALSNATKLTELGIAAPQVVAHRLTRMATAGPVPSQRDRREFTGMVLEKQVAFTQAWFAASLEMMGAQQRMFLAMLGLRAPSTLADTAHAIVARSIAPIHRKAVSNSKRLAKARRR
jgi:hypothetical protein